MMILTVLGILLETIIFICDSVRWKMSVIDTLLTPINKERIVSTSNIIAKTIPFNKNFINDLPLTLPL